MNEITAKEKEMIINDTVKILDELNGSSRYSRICTDTRAKAHEIYPRIEEGMVKCMKSLNLPAPPALTEEAVLNAMEPCNTHKDSNREAWQPPRDNEVEHDTSFRQLMTCTA